MNKKAKQSRRFADCVEFYDDWGGDGDNIRLDISMRYRRRWNMRQGLWKRMRNTSVNITNSKNCRNA